MDMTSTLLKNGDKMLYWSTHQPGFSYIVLIMTLIWTYRDYPSMEPMIGVFTGAALLAQYLYEKRNKATTPFLNPVLERAAWVGAKAFDLTKADQKIFGYYRRLIAIKDFSELESLDRDFAEELENIRTSKPDRFEYYSEFDQSIKKAIEVVTSLQASVQIPGIGSMPTILPDSVPLSTRLIPGYIVVLGILVLIRLIRFIV